MEQIPYTYLKYIINTIEELKARNFTNLKDAKSYIENNGGEVFHEEENFIDFNYDNISATFYQEGEDVVMHGLIEAWDDVGDKILEILK